MLPRCGKMDSAESLRQDFPQFLLCSDPSGQPGGPLSRDKHYFILLTFWLIVNQYNSRSPKRWWEVLLVFPAINISSVWFDQQWPPLLKRVPKGLCASPTYRMMQSSGGTQNKMKPCHSGSLRTSECSPSSCWFTIKNKNSWYLLNIDKPQVLC